ncbi:hypothetical protein FLBR109950_08585 [Flavobacterium branchiophilum]
MNQLTVGVETFEDYTMWQSSPDWSGNPFCFFFKNKKIVA